ncbi:hypothetical protein AAFC00_006214 [Neodothiora populina]|uniref:Cytochrome P450 n=1 Tax=Neodothiora populina TaxID=2781224 RepID=A0ABR3P4D8_9PEZI
MDVSLLAFLVLLASFIVYIIQYIRPKHDAREPPLLPTKLPVIGHVIGLIRYGFPYVVNHRRKNQPPIFTIDFGVKKVYVVTSSKIVQAVQRSSNVISVDHLLETAGERIAGIDVAGRKILAHAHHGGHSMHKEIVHAMQPALLGSALDKMNVTMASKLNTFIDDFVKTMDESATKKVDLFKWCQQAIVVASAEATWGPLNPLNDPAVEQAFHNFDANLGTLILNILPKITSPIAYNAREVVVKAFTDFYNKGGQHSSSALAHARWKVQHDGGCSTEDIARLETATVIGVVSNSIVSAFYSVLDIYSRPDLLARLREEIEQNAVVTTQPEEQGVENVIDVARIRDSCPNLISAFQETLRFRSQASPSRAVTEDVLIANGEYLLKKGSLLFMPSKSINYEAGIWGTKADVFDPLRFAAATTTTDGAAPPTTNTAAKVRPSSFMAFGVAPALCPGRHFATGEILALVAMMILRFDLTPAGGKWAEPKNLNSSAVATTIPPPADPFEVEMSLRDGTKAGKWGVRVSEGKGKFGLITG